MKHLLDTIRLHWRRADPWLLAGIVAAFAAWAVLAFFSILAGPPGPTALPNTGTALAEALSRTQLELTRAWAEVALRPECGPAWLRVASWELRRADVLAHQRFLRRDPEGCLTRATAAARAALSTGEEGGLTDGQRRQALELLADARARLGDPRGEAQELEIAAEAEPGNARLWTRLAEARGRARQFARAEKARARPLAPLDTGEGDTR
jgi:hypothetical protein